MLLECEQGNISEKIQRNWLAQLELWRWEVVRLHPDGGVWMLQFGGAPEL